MVLCLLFVACQCPQKTVKEYHPSSSTICVYQSRYSKVATVDCFDAGDHVTFHDNVTLNFVSTCNYICVKHEMRTIFVHELGPQLQTARTINNKGARR